MNYRIKLHLNLPLHLLIPAALFLVHIGLMKYSGMHLVQNQLPNSMAVSQVSYFAHAEEEAVLPDVTHDSFRGHHTILK